jgi:ubiquinone biosynthesis protein UbiJ
MPISNVTCAVLESALNRLLRLDPETRSQLAELQGRVIELNLKGLDETLFVVPSPRGVEILTSYEGEADCTLRGTPISLAAMSRDAGDARQLFSGEVEITGDTELGHRFGSILSRLDVDWEEQMSRLTGDLVAHQVGGGVRSALQWGKRGLNAATTNLREYLQEEIRLLPSRYEANEFLAQVDGLRDDVERLEARVSRLRQKLTDKAARR